MKVSVGSIGIKNSNIQDRMSSYAVREGFNSKQSQWVLNEETKTVSYKSLTMKKKNNKKNNKKKTVIMEIMRKGFEGNSQNSLCIKC